MGKRTSDPTGVVGCTEECKSTAMVCMLNHTIVEFRPNRAWRGEFGFDWLRVNDDPVPGHVPNEPPYENCIIGSKNSGYTPATPNAAAYGDLKTEYHKLGVNTHRAAPRNEYFIPWLNLYAENIRNQINNEYRTKNGVDLPVKPPFEAELRLIVNVQGDTKPKELEIVFPSEFFTIEYPAGAAATGSPITIPAADACFTPNSPGINHELPNTIKIKCIREFSKDQYIDVWAHHYEHTQAEIDQLEQENQQLSDTDIPALKQEETALETEIQALQTQIATQETQIGTQQAAVIQLTAEIAELAAQCAARMGIYQAMENLLQLHAALSDEEKQATENPDFQQLNLPGGKEQRQAEIDALKAEAEELEQQIAQKNTQLQNLQNQLKDMQTQLEEKKVLLEEKQNQLEGKQQEIEQKQEQITKNTEEMNKMQGRSLAGKLCVCANNKKHRKTCKVLLINVRTNFSTPAAPMLDDVGTQTAAEVNQFYRVLYQALVYPDIERNLPFDRSADPKFKRGSNISKNHFVNMLGRIKYQNSDGYNILGDCFSHLKQEFYKLNRNYKSNKCYPLFFFGAPGDGIVGVAPLGGKTGLMFTGRVDSTFPHEALHGLGLHHTHMDYWTNAAGAYVPHYTNATIPTDFKYIYFLGFSNNPAHPDVSYNAATSNIVSYKKTAVVDDRFDTWRWQWQVLREHL